MGHVLRRDDTLLELTALVISDPHAERQAVPAPWHSMWTFAVTTCKDLG